MSQLALELLLLCATWNACLIKAAFNVTRPRTRFEKKHARRVRRGG